MGLSVFFRAETQRGFLRVSASLRENNGNTKPVTYHPVIFFPEQRQIIQDYF